jgi:signal transduction histidine kinase
MIKNKSIRYIFFVILSIGIFIPLVNIYFILPAFTNLLIKNTENDAVRIVAPLTSTFRQEYTGLTKDSISPDLINKIKMFQDDFPFIQLKLFSRNGEIIYPFGSRDIGEIKDNLYFHQIVSKGNPYSKLVKIDDNDVIETYVPIMSDNKFIGALGVYYDVTSEKQILTNLVLKAGFIPFTMMLGGVAITILILIQLDKSILKQKKAEDELRVFAEKLQRSNRELENFANIASHDLQEPLRKVIAFGEKLKTKYSEVINESGRDYLERMQNAARRMQTLINDLLSFSRVSTKAQPFVPVNLTKVAHEVISDLEVLIKQKNGRVEVDDLITIDADPLQMRQLLQNLIGNALKFSKEDTPPIVKIYGKVIHPKDGETPEKLYELTVEDNGIGFEERYADRIFGVFQRLHSRKEYEGTGIGLSICHKIVERHNGKIIAKSSPGEGATFIITLPLKQKEGGSYGS